VQRFIAHLLIVLAAWTLLIKFVFPVAMAASEKIGLLSYVYWDFWWVIHLWLAYALIKEPAYTYWLAMATSVVEIVIIVTKFVLFLSAPEWNIWQTNWFINKVFVLAAFILLFGYLLGPGARLRQSRPRGRG
jgi:hypothetical protein